MIAQCRSGLASIFSSDRLEANRNIMPILTLSLNTLPAGDHQRAHRLNSAELVNWLAGENRGKRMVEVWLRSACGSNARCFRLLLRADVALLERDRELGSHSTIGCGNLDDDPNRAYRRTSGEDRAAKRTEPLGDLLAHVGWV
jgi:hypothetical protein